MWYVMKCEIFFNHQETVEYLNLDQPDRWHQLPKMNFKRRQHACAVLQVAKDDVGILV